MRLTEKEKKEMLRIAEKRLRTEKDEWWARHFAGLPQGWIEEEEE